MFRKSLSGQFIEFARRMPLRSRLLCRLKAFPFFRLDMQKLRALHILNIIEHLHEIVHVMTIHRSKITDAEPLEQVMLLREQCLQTVVEA